MKSFPFLMIAVGTWFTLGLAACGGTPSDDNPGDGDANGDGDGDGDGDGETTYFVEGILLRDGLCFPRELATDAEGNIGCKVVDLAGPDHDCEASGLMAASPALAEATLAQVESAGYCGGDVGVECVDSFTVCVLPQLQGEAADLCATDPRASDTFQSVGFCYIDEAESLLVADCPATEQRTLRAVGVDIPLSGGPDFLACGN